MLKGPLNKDLTENTCDFIILLFIIYLFFFFCPINKHISGYWFPTEIHFFFGIWSIILFLYDICLLFKKIGFWELVTTTSTLSSKTLLCMFLWAEWFKCWPHFFMPAHALGAVHIPSLFGRSFFDLLVQDFVQFCLFCFCLQFLS